MPKPLRDLERGSGFLGLIPVIFLTAALIVVVYVTNNNKNQATPASADYPYPSRTPGRILRDTPKPKPTNFVTNTIKNIFGKIVEKVPVPTQKPRRSP